MSEVFIGAMQPFGFPFAPRDWMICNGAVLPIAQYETLYALIGTIYGGDGVSTFAIPDTRGRILLGQGSTFFGSNYAIGQVGGLETYTLTTQNLPMHTHMLLAATQGGTLSAPANTDHLAAASGNDPTSGDAVTVNIYAPAGAAEPMTGVMPAGSNQATTIMQPFLVNNYCIAVQGIFPSRN